MNFTRLKQFFTNKKRGLGVVKKLKNKEFKKGEYSDKPYNGVLLHHQGWVREYLFTDHELQEARERAVKNLTDFKDFDKK